MNGFSRGRCSSLEEGHGGRDCEIVDKITSVLRASYSMSFLDEGSLDPALDPPMGWVG